MGNSQRDRALRRKAAHDLLAARWPVRDVADVLGVHRDTVYGWMRDLDAAAAAARDDCASLAEVLSDGA